MISKDITHRLMLYNDEANTFLYVIACLIKFCDHEKDQADQCALIVHNNGKCDIKHGNFLEMLEIQENLSNLGLKVEIEEYESNLHK